jgi:hypothetical protein
MTSWNFHALPVHVCDYFVVGGDWQTSNTYRLSGCDAGRFKNTFGDVPCEQCSVIVSNASVSCLLASLAIRIRDIKCGMFNAVMVITCRKSYYYRHFIEKPRCFLQLLSAV